MVVLGEGLLILTRMWHFHFEFLSSMPRYVVYELSHSWPLSYVVAALLVSDGICALMACY